MSSRNHYYFEDKENLLMHTPEKVQAITVKENLEKNVKYLPDCFIGSEISQDDYLFEKKRLMSKSGVRNSDFELRLT